MSVVVCCQNQEETKDVLFYKKTGPGFPADAGKPGPVKIYINYDSGANNPDGGVVKNYSLLSA